MLKELWNKTHCSICSITFLKNDTRITSGSGFRVGKYIITNNHVIDVPSADKVKVNFVSHDGHTSLFVKEYSNVVFQSFLKVGDTEKNWDYAILELNDSDIEAVPAIKIAENNTFDIGKSIALLGFQFEQQNLSMHQGIISSSYERNGVRYIQLDSSVNYGNSGGPLIDVDTGDVIGLVTRKATGLTEQFDNLIKSYDDNISALQSALGVMTMPGGVDPIQAIITSQNQMKKASQEMKRSANVGIGYAYCISKVRESLDIIA